MEPGPIHSAWTLNFVEILVAAGHKSIREIRTCPTSWRKEWQKESQLKWLLWTAAVVVVVVVVAADVADVVVVVVGLVGSCLITCNKPSRFVWGPRCRLYPGRRRRRCVFGDTCGHVGTGTTCSCWPLRPVTASWLWTAGTALSSDSAASANMSKCNKWIFRYNNNNNNNSNNNSNNNDNNIETIWFGGIYEVGN